MQYSQGESTMRRLLPGGPKGSLIKLTRKAETIMQKLTDLQILILEKGQMSCADLRKCYGDYFDGELPVTVRGKLATHIEECPRCQEFAASYRLTVDLARELRNKPMPSDVQKRLRASLNARLGLNLPVE
ncbi:MAG: hypothetical protein EBZ48_17300 [Proteobacteria bacterium]|nr:hypothetical protein [Pseudomonadota bacterium]